MITFYQVEWCPYCHTIRQLMTELGLTYTTVNVAADPEQRPEVVAVSGQKSVPVLQDGDRVLSDGADIVEYLRNTYPTPDDADLQARKGAWRTSRKVSLPARAAVARLEELLAARGFQVVARFRGPEIADQLPEEYTLLQVTVPVAAAKAYELDPLAPTALLLPMAVIPADGGWSTVASGDPVGQVWLFGQPELTRAQSAVKKRLVEVLADL